MSFKLCLQESLRGETKHVEVLCNNITRNVSVKVLNLHEYTFLSVFLFAFPTQMPMKLYKHHFRAFLCSAGTSNSFLLDPESPIPLSLNLSASQKISNKEKAPESPVSHF